MTCARGHKFGFSSFALHAMTRMEVVAEGCVDQTRSSVKGEFDVVHVLRFDRSELSRHFSSTVDIFLGCVGAASEFHVPTLN